MRSVGGNYGFNDYLKIHEENKKLKNIKFQKIVGWIYSQHSKDTTVKVQWKPLYLIKK